MRLRRLRIVGFKSFVEPTEFLIEPGLTGIVGPNGCGKSNLVEALRWVMGETSHKRLRASGMDDVIFAGSTNRPARNFAEVILTVENSDRRAPAAFNDADEIEVSRRIARDSGSLYRVNSREVRARDVQLLFADAATGARSAALVRQGQISEIIAAKPQARRRILEDAAGIAGLHARRHEAELRLKGAEDNLLRVEDVLRELGGQIESLKRQSRQAARYRAIAAEIRRLEAVLLLIGHVEARAQVAAAERQAEADLGAVAERTTAQAEAAKAQAILAHALPGLREADAGAAAALQRLVLGRSELDAEERRMRERSAELERQLAELDKDLARQGAVQADAAATIARLEAEAAALAQDEDAAQAARSDIEARLEAAERDLAEGEAALGGLQARLSDLKARRAAFERTHRQETDRKARFTAEKAGIMRDLQALERLVASPEGGQPIAALRHELATADEAACLAEERAGAAREALAAAREEESRSHAALNEAERGAQRLETEARTLARLFAADAGGPWRPLLDAVAVAPGYETALGAAMGEDLDASLDPGAPMHWAGTGPGDDDPALPAGVTPLSGLVQAPPVLARRLKQIGLVDRAEGADLRAALKPGQRLVSREGDVWRWDGFTAVAEAPTAAARRLAERNRLAELEREAGAARAAAERLRRDAERAQAAARAGAVAESKALEGVRQARRLLDLARERLSAAERREAEVAAKRSALEEALARVAASESEAALRAEEAGQALAGLADAPDLEGQLLEARSRVAEDRAMVTQARAALQTLWREAEMAARRRDAIAADIRLWSERAERAAGTARDLETRLARARSESEALQDLPDTLIRRRRALLAEIERAEGERKAAADRLAEGETALAAADRAARAALSEMATAREALAGSQARLDAARQRASEITRAIADHLGTTPAGLRELAGLAPDAALPDASECETRLVALKGDRERLGAVNLRAEEELAAIEDKSSTLVAERDDLVEAIKRLRQAVSNLNREGRERLLAAFDVVNRHFQQLFTTLFGGGTAELTLIESDDPLEAGLEILARPPGKKLQTMTLLSGGEQALTATALIFAVFLTNPSPICVLDEVDAPLDDANVERYCDLLHEMARQTETRFVVITHNPITMARMDRLFGVTMAERGVSQLVSVDLESGEALRQAV